MPDAGKPKIPFKLNLTPEQQKRARRLRLISIPGGMLVGLSFLALLMGGPKRFFAAAPGPIFAGLYVLQIFVERLIRPLDLGGERRDEGTFGKLWMAAWSSYLVAMADFYWIQPTWRLVEWSWLWIAVGAPIVVLGESLRLVAIRSLGRFFTVSVRLHEGHRIIQDGVYRWMRHPAYTGLLIGTAGYITLFASPLGYLVFLVLMVPAVMNRMRVEERALLDQFGDEYRAYGARTKRLVPFIY